MTTATTTSCSTTRTSTRSGPSGWPSPPAGRRSAGRDPSPIAWPTSRRSGPTCAPAVCARRWAHDRSRPPRNAPGSRPMSQLESALERPWIPAEPPVDRLPSVLRPLRNRNYALLFTGQLSSLIGDQLYVVALPFLILGHASVRQLGLVLMCFGLARIAALPIGGVLADRMSRI